MATDFTSTYQPPGVYIDETETTLVPVTGTPPTVVAIVGPARGHRAYTEQIISSVESPVTLAKKGIVTTSVRVTAVESGVLIPPASYMLATAGTTTSQNYSVTIAGVEDLIEDGTALYVTYDYTEPGYYDPRTFTNFEDIKAHYGEPLNASAPVPGEVYEPVASPLSLAAMLAIRNGATSLVLCATPPPADTIATVPARSEARRAALAAAYAKITSDQTVTVVVPLTVGITDAHADETVGDLHTALTASAAEQIYRMGVIGFEPTDPSTPLAPDVLAATALAGATNRRRVVIAHAADEGLLLYSGAASTTFAVGHHYFAAALAGRMQSLPVQIALTKQFITGFSGAAGIAPTNAVKSRYSASGVTVGEIDRQGRLVVRHGVTADTSSARTREISVVRSRDAMVRALYEGADNSGLYGQPIDGDLVLSVKSMVSGILEQTVSDDVILGYTGLSVRQSPDNPTAVLINFGYRPAYPLNYIGISFTIDSTGEVSLVDDVA